MNRTTDKLAAALRVLIGALDGAEILKWNGADVSLIAAECALAEHDAEQPTAPDDWISVDDSLPEPSTPLDQKHVWVYVPGLPYGYGPDGCQHVGLHYELTGWRVVGSHTDRVVTHWRPMPPIPAR